jgi:hypothetical protein
MQLVYSRNYTRECKKKIYSKIEIISKSNLKSEMRMRCSSTRSNVVKRCAGQKRGKRQQGIEKRGKQF